MTLDSAVIAHWQTWIGRTETRSELLELESLRRYAAALGESLDVENVPPSLAHWAFFLPVATPDQLGPDGHPRRGGFLPPVTLPRRDRCVGLHHHVRLVGSAVGRVELHGRLSVRAFEVADAR